MNRYFIQLSFEGSSYHGWQIQKNAHAIQEELNKALAILCRGAIETIGCGRTDTGVHAPLFFAHFDYSTKIKDTDYWVNKINRLLPHCIAVQDIFSVDSNTHARFDAISRTYEYRIHQKKNPFLLNRSYYLYEDVDIDKMNEAAALLLLHDDFSCFSKSRTQTKTNRCKISNAAWTKDKEQLIFTITADRFLRNMVRAIVGTLLEIGTGKMPLEDFRKVIESKSRSLAGKSVPACGLYLIDVVYPKSIRETV